jgi:cobalt-zinc-cadmium resistance protein CzcA
MSEKLIRWALDNRLFVVLLVATLIAGGLAALDRLTIDAVPDVTNVQVQIVTSAPALGPLEVEQYLTYPVESAMSGLPDVVELRSTSRYGISSVTVVFKDGTPLFFARQLVQERLPAARADIPAGLASPEMIPPTTGLGEVYHFTLEGDGYSPMELRSILDWQIAFRLRQVPGVRARRRAASDTGRGVDHFGRRSRTGGHRRARGNADPHPRGGHGRGRRDAP